MLSIYMGYIVHVNHWFFYSILKRQFWDDVSLFMSKKLALVWNYACGSVLYIINRQLAYNAWWFEAAA